MLYSIVFDLIIKLRKIRDGVVGNISACHADARGSIPRRGGFMQLRSIRRHFGRVVKAAAC